MIVPRDSCPRRISARGAMHGNRRRGVYCRTARRRRRVRSRRYKRLYRNNARITSELSPTAVKYHINRAQLDKGKPLTYILRRLRAGIGIQISNNAQRDII